jgi:stearoyl-CoA desaturase (delta-9 desaturase)
MDLHRDPVHRFFERFNLVIPLSVGLLLYPAGQLWGGVGVSWVLWGFFFRTAFIYNATHFVNSATHKWGYRNFETRDDSTNLWWVAIFSLGEGWHNNHHAYPRSARHGLRWWELDFTYMMVTLLRAFGLARHIHVPGAVLSPMQKSAGAVAAATEPSSDPASSAPELVQTGP